MNCSDTHLAHVCSSCGGILNVYASSGASSWSMNSGKMCFLKQVKKNTLIKFLQVKIFPVPNCHVPSAEVILPCDQYIYHTYSAT